MSAAAARGGRRGHDRGGAAARDERGLSLFERVGTGRQPWWVAGGIAVRGRPVRQRLAWQIPWTRAGRRGNRRRHRQLPPQRIW